MRSFICAVTATTFALLGSTATAAVLTFDGIQSEFFTGIEVSDFTEDGFITELAGSGLFGGYDDLHLDFSGDGPFMDAVSVRTVSGNPFTLNSLLIEGLIRPDQYTGAAQDDVTFEAFRGGALTATTAGTSQLGDRIMSFGTDFASIDQLFITGIYPTNFDFTEIDFHFGVDDIDVTEISMPAVPLPASGLLLLSTVLFVSGGAA